jgi:hypothetical protein
MPKKETHLLILPRIQKKKGPEPSSDMREQLYIL